MTKEQIQQAAELSVNQIRYAKIYFKDHTRCPQFGKFVMMEDHEEQVKRGFIRFVSRSQDEAFAARPRYENTRLMRIDTLNYIIVV